MDIKQAGSRPSTRPSADYFTGTVRLDPIVEGPDPARVRARFDTAGDTAVVKTGRGRFGNLQGFDTSFIGQRSTHNNSVFYHTGSARLVTVQPMLAQT